MTGGTLPSERELVDMDDMVWFAERFEEHRPRLLSVAYRMLGSLTDAEDALQEAWVRSTRADGSTINNVGGWLTTVVGRVCIDLLRSRKARRENLTGTWLPEPRGQQGRTAQTRKRRTCSPTRSAWPCSSSWRPSTPPSGWPSCSTTCSGCRSPRSRRS